MNGITIKYYAGNMVYNKVIVNNKVTFQLSYLLFDEGLVTRTSAIYSYEYHLKDHPPKVGQTPGNSYVTFQPNGSNTTTTKVAEYYPFGSSYLPISPSGTNEYLYNGKEKQDDVLDETALDWYDYGARFYDPALARWHSVTRWQVIIHHGHLIILYTIILFFWLTQQEWVLTGIKASQVLQFGKREMLLILPSMERTSEILGKLTKTQLLVVAI